MPRLNFETRSGFAAAACRWPRRCAVARRFADQPKQGGEVVVTFKDDLATLDPAIGYDWQNWSIIKSIFSGLMDYKPGTTELTPDLARELHHLRRRPDLYLQAARRASNSTTAGP